MTARRVLPMPERVRLFERALGELLALAAARLTDDQPAAPAPPPAPEPERDEAGSTG